MLFDIFNVRKYSARWFQEVSDEELYREREPVRLKAVYDGDPVAERLLNRFGNEEIRRMNEKFRKEHPNAKPRHREHGWYLENDE